MSLGTLGMEGMQQRREHARLRLGIEAELVGLNGRQAVVLQDLSATGAKVQLRNPARIDRGILSWFHFEVFGEVVWQRNGWCGMAFDRPLSDGCLFETRDAAPGLQAEARLSVARYAQEFVNGQRRL